MQLTPALLDDFLRRGHARGRVASTICWALCAAYWTAPSHMSCWKPRRCRLARVRKPRSGSRLSLTSLKCDGSLGSDRASGRVSAANRHAGAAGGVPSGAERRTGGRLDELGHSGEP